MSAYGKIPENIVLNNPGALRRGFGGPRRITTLHGYAVFLSPEEGITHILRKLHDEYMYIGHRTFIQIASRFFNPEKHSLQCFVQELMKLTGREVESPRLFDTRMDQKQKALVMTTALIEIINGVPTTKWPHHPYWYPQSVFETAAREVNRW